MTAVECFSRVTTDAREDTPLTASAISSWLETVPSNARITHLTKDIGTQRDPWILLYGLQASWTEER